MEVSTVTIVITISTVITAALAETEDDVYDHLDHQLDEVLDNHVSHLFGTQDHNQRVKRSDDIASQTVYQFQKKAKKCKTINTFHKLHIPYIH